MVQILTTSLIDIILISNLFKRFKINMNSPSRRKTQKGFAHIYSKYSIPETINVRELQSEDYHKGYYELLNQLAPSPKLSEEEFEEQLKAIKEESILHRIIIIEDAVNGALIASGTVFLERKFIRANATAGHIEDIIVNSEYRQKGYGKTLISILKEIAFEAGAYKIILDCSDSNTSFYEKNGFSRAGCEMKIYSSSVERAPKEANV